MQSDQVSAPQGTSDLKYGDFRGTGRSSSHGYPRKEMCHHQQDLQTRSESAPAATAISGHPLLRD